MPTLVHSNELRVWQKLHIALTAVERRDLVVLTPHNQCWRVYPTQQHRERLVEHVRFPCNASGHLAIDFPGHELINLWLFSVELVHFTPISKPGRNIVSGIKQKLVHDFPV